MAARVILNLDGKREEYELPTSGLTFREAGYVKRMSGVRGGEINEALAAGDAECIAALIGIAIRRSGKPISDEELLDLEVESVDFERDEEPDPQKATEATEGATPPEEPVA